MAQHMGPRGGVQAVRQALQEPAHAGCRIDFRPGEDVLAFQHHVPDDQAGRRGLGPGLRAGCAHQQGDCHDKPDKVFVIYAKLARFS
ncbi:MAG: hypothetical protein IPH48_20175 [bacterium]|nr:hypothetical protein [bacterium]